MAFPLASYGLPNRPSGLPEKERTCYAGYSVVKVQRTDYIRQREKRRRMECAAIRSSSVSASLYFLRSHSISIGFKYAV